MSKAYQSYELVEVGCTLVVIQMEGFGPYWFLTTRRLFTSLTYKINLHKSQITDNLAVQCTTDMFSPHRRFLDRFTSERSSERIPVSTLTPPAPDCGPDLNMSHM